MVIKYKGQGTYILLEHNEFTIEIKYTKEIACRKWGRRLCVFVGKLIGEQQVVIKGVPHHLEQSSMKGKGIGGVSY